MPSEKSGARRFKPGDREEILSQSWANPLLVAFLVLLAYNRIYRMHISLRRTS